MSEREPGTPRYLFGPVPSRRFGRSLGIDLTPRKTCTLNCVFCQLGPTLRPTLTRREYVPTRAVLAELDAWFASGATADVLTLSGSGEPTLHVGFGDVLAHIRARTPAPALLLTNGTTLTLPEVRSAAALASIVKISFGAWDRVSFERLTRPHPALQWERIVDGQRAFRDAFDGELRIEVFVVPGINDTEDAMRRIAALTASIRPDRVQLNTAVRPPADGTVRPVEPGALTVLARLFDPPGEVIGEFAAPEDARVRIGKSRILDLLKRRPATAQQIAEAFGLHPHEVAKHLGLLIRAERIRTERRNDRTYYVAAPPDA